MEHIIATTDLSPNSRAGMRFAIQLAQQRNASLTFLHIYQVLRASFWSDQQYGHYIAAARQAVMEELSRFVREVYRSMKVKQGDYEVVAHHHLDTVDGILDYTTDHRADYICISTHGAGPIRRLLGSITGSLITRSAIPVLTIPSRYRVKPVTSVLYASDLSDYEQELARVVGFARPLKAPVALLHFSRPFELIIGKEELAQKLRQQTGYDVRFHSKDRNIGLSLLEEIGQAVKTVRPSVLVLFTNQERSLFERIFLSSKAAAFASRPLVPLLSFHKRTTGGKEQSVVTGAAKQTEAPAPSVFG